MRCTGGRNQNGAWYMIYHAYTIEPELKGIFPNSTLYPVPPFNAIRSLIACQVDHLDRGVTYLPIRQSAAAEARGP